MRRSVRWNKFNQNNHIIYTNVEAVFSVKATVEENMIVVQIQEQVVSVSFRANALRKGKNNFILAPIMLNIKVDVFFYF